METIDRYIELENGDFAVDLFPYKIKDVNNFYNREHPKDLNPRTFLYKKYWGARAKDYTEGRWINDSGTWFFLMPKLDFYLNYVIISDEDRNRRHPSLRDIELIMFTYFLCSQGFSGFDGDDKYTCNKYVGKLVNNEKLQAYEKKALDEDKSVLKEDGTYKEYVNPWIYLTETYLLTDNRNKPLGQAIYSNGYYNIMLLACRGLGKTYSVFLGLFLHEWLFGSVRKIVEISDSNNFTQFGMAAADADALSKSIANLDAAYYEFPGQYVFQVNKTSIQYWGPFFKYTRGNWKVGSSGGEVEHILKLKKGGKIRLKGSKCQIALIGNSKARIFAGDRYRLILIEETGFVKNLKGILNASNDSVKVGKRRKGQIVMLGTGGAFELIADAKEVFENPNTYNVFPIPNYWVKKTDKYCGLFLARYLQSEDFKVNGNTNYYDALFDSVKDRELSKATKDSKSFAEETSFNPIYPKELLIPTTKSVLPTQELQDHLDHIISSGLWEQISMIGSFGYNRSDGSVEFRLDKEKTLVPITKWGRDKDIQDATGAWVLYEEPPEFIPEGLYYILYDPYKQSGSGTSLQSILVYKSKYVGYGEGKAMEDTIVASYIGRIPEMDRSYEEAIKAARYFNATIFPEMNDMGFGEYVNRKNYNFLMQKTPVSLLKTIKGSTWRAHDRSAFNFGVKVNEPMNIWSINRLANWLMEVIMVDDKGLPIKRRYQNIVDLRLLSELVNFDFENKVDFDSVSALMLLPYLLGDMDEAVEVLVDDSYDPYSKYELKPFATTGERPVAKINKY